MICPNCGSEQTESSECLNCGIIFTKFEERKKKKQEARPYSVSRWNKPANTTTRIIRKVLGVAGILLAVLMGFSGSAFSSFGPYFSLVFFGLAGAYFLIPTGSQLRIGRVAMEIAGFIGISIILTAAFPEVFSLSKPMYESTFTGPLPGNAIKFNTEARARIKAVRTFIATEEIKEAADALKLQDDLDFGNLSSMYGELPDEDRTKAEDIMLPLNSLAPLLGTLEESLTREMPRGPALWVPESIKADIEKVLVRVEKKLSEFEAALAKREKEIRNLK
jgi:hypothetical protein